MTDAPSPSSSILQAQYDIISECISYGDIAGLQLHVNDFPSFLKTRNLDITSSSSLTTTSPTENRVSSSFRHPIIHYYPYLLHLSVHYDSLPVIQFLVSMGYSPAALDTYGWTVYDLCIYYGKRTYLSVLPPLNSSSAPSTRSNISTYKNSIVTTANSNTSNGASSSSTGLSLLHPSVSSTSLASTDIIRNDSTSSITSLPSSAGTEYDKPNQRTGSVSPSYPSSYHHRILAPNEYQLYITLGSLATVNATQNSSPITYADNENHSLISSSSSSSSYLSTTVTAQMDTESLSPSNERYCIHGYRLYPSLPLSSSSSPHRHSLTWSSRPVPVLPSPVPSHYRSYDGKFCEKETDASTDPSTDPWMNNDGYTVLNLDKGDTDTMIFTVKDIQQCSIRFQLFTTRNTNSCTNFNSYNDNNSALSLGEGLISSRQFTQPSSTATVTPWSNGIENLAFLPPSSGEAHDASVGLTSFRLSGQLIIPLMKTSMDSRTNFPRIRSVGELTLRYLFVRGGQSILNPLYGIPSSVRNETIIATPPIPSGTVEVIQPDNVSVSSSTAASDSRSTFPVVRSPLLDKHFWTTRTRIFGHRGSGADSAAIIQTTANDNTSITSSSVAVTDTSLSNPSRSSDSNGPIRRTHILENTLLSFIEASKAGAKFCEFDVQLSRDGHPIIHHDWTLALPVNSNNSNNNGTNTCNEPTDGSGIMNPYQPSRSLSFGFSPSFPSSSSSVSSLSSLYDTQAISSSIRVPITHLTLAQIRSLTPRAMTTGSVVDEFELAKAADDAHTNYQPLVTNKSTVTGILRNNSLKSGRSLSNMKSTEGIVPTVTPDSLGGLRTMESVPSSSESSSTIRSVSRSRPPLPRPILTGDISSNASIVSLPSSSPSPVSSSSSSSSSSSPGSSSSTGKVATVNPLLFSPPRSPDSSAASFNKRTLAALGLDPGRADITRLSVSYHYGLRDTFTTLEETLYRVPRECGFNIEVKYATTNETALFGLRQFERNIFVDRILDVIAHVEGSYIRPECGNQHDVSSSVNGTKNSKPRSILFSSFDPDICLLLARKQNYYPVFFLTEAGTPSIPNPDPRMNSLYGAQHWANFTGLLGIVTHTKPIQESYRTLIELQYSLNQSSLIIGTYGSMNNNPEYVKKQMDWGVNIVIVDHVAHVRKHTG